jgi:hypothetical protein
MCFAACEKTLFHLLTNDTYSTMVGDFVNDAKEMVEAAWDWSALRTRLTITTAADDYTYSLTGTGDKGKLLNLINDTSNLEMDVPNSKLV